MSLVLIGTGLVILLAIHYLWVAEGRLILGPETIFLVLASGTYVASAFYASPRSEIYVRFIGAGIAAYLLGTFLSKLVLRFEHRRELAGFMQAAWVNDVRGARMAAVFALAVFAAGVTAAYFIALGFYVPFAALQTLFEQGPQEMIVRYNYLRSLTSAGGRYLGLGYVAQFKDCVLPLTTLILYFRWRLVGGRWNLVTFAVLLSVSVAAAIGTGARFGVALIGATLVFLGLAPYMHPLRFTRRQIVVVTVTMMILLSSLTLMMGSRGIKTLDVPVLWAPYQVVERVFISPSQQRLEVYERFLADKDPLWGAGALGELAQVLPGPSKLTLTNYLHELLFGSALGNVSLDPWGSLWYDFHWWGLVLAVGLGFTMNAYYVWLLRGPKNLIRVITLAYAGVLLGLATDLQVLLLYGFLTCFLFLGVVRTVEWLAATQRAHEARPGRVLSSGG